MLGFPPRVQSGALHLETVPFFNDAWTTVDANERHRLPATGVSLAVASVVGESVGFSGRPRKAMPRGNALV